ncbi:SCP2 sterol-binding domain-containing protein [Streptomyces sp. NPDC059740]|uniref:SCP2 sterol-binding domain-containing protein n=1 Tax=Streptomyces sp. NPDC059740 TaxID=3346926 RepID=UPI00364CD5C2
MTEDVAAELAALDFASVTPEEFATIVKGLSRAQLAQVATGELRERVLAEVFGRMERQFRPENAGSLSAVIRWKITGESEVVYETAIENGTCTVTKGASARTARVTLSMADADFLKLASGNSTPVGLFLSRKVRAVGDLGLAAGLSRLFDIPKV